MSDARAHKIGLGLIEFLTFGIKQAWACLFGAIILGVIILTAIYYPQDFWITRYDLLFVITISVQAIFLITRLEHWSEATVILIFHIVGTAMEVFKTSVGSWTYPEECLFHIGAVPLFTGFMYAAVGSYIARIWRIFDFTFTGYPKIWVTMVLAALIYINFFSHHYIVDVRYLLFAAVFFIYRKCWIYFRVWRWRHRMPMLLGFGLVTLFIWLAENIGTMSKAWFYPNQADGWSMVSLQKFGAWYLLMIISFVLVTLVHRIKTHSPSRDDI